MPQHYNSLNGLPDSHDLRDFLNYPDPKGPLEKQPLTTNQSNGILPTAPLPTKAPRYVNIKDTAFCVMPPLPEVCLSPTDTFIDTHISKGSSLLIKAEDLPSPYPSVPEILPTAPLPTQVVVPQEVPTAPLPTQLITPRIQPVFIDNTPPTTEKNNTGNIMTIITGILILLALGKS